MVDTRATRRASKTNIAAKKPKADPGRAVLKNKKKNVSRLSLLSFHAFNVHLQTPKEMDSSDNSVEEQVSGGLGKSCSLLTSA